ncbi:MAG: hypothetical protein KME09_17765 [Pleurocapsa minor HA4230-MV1]|nr:hypothetical protein [Pleurocapsa minor HA4230-MV1]MBW4535789.1 hypothetical protein [Pleurocapsa minor HA4230-MV1]
MIKPLPLELFVTRPKGLVSHSFRRVLGRKIPTQKPTGRYRSAYYSLLVTP